MGSCCGCGLEDDRKGLTLAEEIETNLSDHKHRNGKSTPTRPQEDPKKDRKLTTVPSQESISDGEATQANE